MKKGFAPILILVILLAVGTAAAVGWYFVNKNSSPENTSPAATTSTEANISTDETANWETFTDNTYEYSIKLPTDWWTLEGSLIYYSGDYSETGSGEGPGPKWVSGSTLYVSNYPGDIQSLGDAKEIIVDGEKAKIITRKNDKGESYDLSVQHNDRHYYINFESKSPNMELFNQILSTFKFTDQKLSKEQAVEKVKNLPEVKDYISQASNPVKVEYDHDDEDQDIYVIHVYEVLPDHVATFNWYDVNRTTGSISKMF